MNKTQRLLFSSDTPFAKIAQASTAIVICGLPLLILMAFLWGASSSIIAKANALGNRASNIENFEDELHTRRQEMSELFQAAGITLSNSAISFDAEIAKELLLNDSTNLIEVMKLYGFSLNTQSDLSEVTISPTLSLHQSQITFSGSPAAFSTLIAHHSNVTGYVGDLTIDGSLTEPNNQFHSVSVKLRRFGPSSIISEDMSNE